MSRTSEELLLEGGLAANLEAELPALASTIARELGDLEIPNHRLSGLVNSLAWHQRRATPELRTQALAEELRRLEARATSEPEAAFYRFLSAQLGLGRAGAGQGRDPLLRGLRIPVEQEARFAALARFSRARAALHIVETLLRSNTLRREIAQNGGAILWQ